MLARVLARPGPGQGARRGTPGARRARNNVPVLTTNRCGEAMQVAVLAAENSMHGLSLRAVRESLKGGPPVMPISMDDRATGIVRTVPGNDEAPDPAMQLVAKYVATLEPLWERHQAPPGEVYETLREVVLPAARPTEIFLYATWLSTPGTGLAARVRGALTQSSSLAARLARWAVRAGRADDLRRRIEERKANPGARPAADVLLGQLAAADGKPTTATEVPR